LIFVDPAEAGDLQKKYSTMFPHKSCDS
jgi:hypothetical protein